MAEDMIVRTAPPRRAPAVGRAISILRRLGDASEPMGVNQLARDLDLVPSTCLHILRALAEEGLVTVDDVSKRYSIGVGILPIARNAILRNGFTTLAQPKLAQISRTYGVTALATELMGGRHMVVTALAHSELPFRLSAQIGSRFPALISATGRCVAAFGGMPPDDLRREFERLTWDNAPSFDRWRGQLDETRRQGYGLDADEYIAGVTIAAVPVFDGSGRVARTLVAIGVSDHVAAVGAAAMAADMLTMRDEIAGCLVDDF